MDDREYDDLMRKALSDRLTWEAMTATEDEADQAYEWLRTAQRRTAADLAARKSTMATAEAKFGGTRSTSVELAIRRRQYSSWRKRALGFKGMVDQRVAELKSAHRRDRRRRMQDERDRYSEAALRLAHMIEAHQAERCRDGDLYELLDEIKLPWGVNGETSLRRILVLKAMHDAEEPATERAS